MSRAPSLALGLALAVVACTSPDRSEAPTEPAAATGPITAAEPLPSSLSQGAAPGSGFVLRTIPDEDPGPPFYARVGVQFLHDGELLAIPFYRRVDCVPAEFNLLDFFHFPGPDGPGAFACPLLLAGRMLIEPDAQPGTFPRRVVLEAAGDVPVWFVDYEAFQSAAQDGVVGLAELESLHPMVGTADRFHETLHPREGEHRIVIDASGRMDDGRTFRFHATHIDDTLRAIRIEFD